MTPPKARNVESSLVDVAVRLPYHPPYDWPAALGHLRARAIAGVEHVTATTYARTFAQRGGLGTLEVAHDEAHHSLTVRLRLHDRDELPSLSARLRRMFDLDCDVATIAAHLARDQALAPLVQARPGLRVLGGWDGFEVGMRAVLGQQVTVAAGRALLGQLIEVCSAAGEPAGMLTRAFPDPAAVVAAELARMRMPASRKATVLALARAALDEPRLFCARASLDEALERLRAIRGIGDWTASYIALRAMKEPDAFPDKDAALRRSMEALEGELSLSALGERAERWRPWRAYAAQHLWAAAPAPSPRAARSAGDPRRKRSASGPQR